MEITYEIVKASNSEVGLVRKYADGTRKGVVTWWASFFDGEMPTLEHPEVKLAIERDKRWLGESI